MLVHGMERKTGLSTLIEEIFCIFGCFRNKLHASRDADCNDKKNTKTVQVSTISYVILWKKL